MRYIAIALLAAIMLSGCAGRDDAEHGAAARYLDSRIVKDNHGCTFTVTAVSYYSNKTNLRLVTELSDPACVKSVYKD